MPEHRTKVDGIEEHGPAKASGSSSAVAKPTRTITVVCPACGKTLRAPASAAGKKAKCPQCGKPVLVPVGSPQMPAAGVPQVPGVGFPQPVPSIYNDDDFAPAGSSAYGLTASAPTSAEPERTACPKCGEMIVAVPQNALTARQFSTGPRGERPRRKERLALREATFARSAVDSWPWLAP